MAIEIKARELAIIKRNAQNIYAYKTKADALDSKIKALQEEKDQLDNLIRTLDNGSLVLTGGAFASLDLIKREMVPTDKTDSQGKLVYSTRFVPRADTLTWNEETKSYWTKDADVQEAEAEPEQEDNVEENESSNEIFKDFE